LSTRLDEEGTNVAGNPFEEGINDGRIAIYMDGKPEAALNAEGFIDTEESADDPPSTVGLLDNSTDGLDNGIDEGAADQYILALTDGQMLAIGIDIDIEVEGLADTLGAAVGHRATDKHTSSSKSTISPESDKQGEALL
jgi:hypothetical protein